MSLVKLVHVVMLLEFVSWRHSKVSNAWINVECTTNTRSFIVPLIILFRFLFSRHMSLSLIMSAEGTQMCRRHELVTKTLLLPDVSLYPYVLCCAFILLSAIGTGNTLVYYKSQLFLNPKFFPPNLCPGHTSIYPSHTILSQSHPNHISIVSQSYTYQPYW